MIDHSNAPPTASTPAPASAPSFTQSRLDTSTQALQALNTSGSNGYGGAYCDARLKYEY